MIPLWKSDFSIGRSILTLDKIFDLAEKEVVLVEDSMSGFRAAKKLSEKTGKPLRFGLRLETEDGSQPSKVIYFAKNAKGVDSLRRIYTKAFTKNEGVYKLDKKELEGIQVAIPFYDSYIHRNLFNFGIHDLDLKGLNPWYFEEENGHPFDFLISRKQNKLSFKTLKVKSIYYEKKEDYPAFCFYKAVCNRGMGKSPTWEKPNLEHFCSDQFSYESFLDKKRGLS